MKRYLLFTFDNYYPGGGWEDFAGDFDTFEEADNAPRRSHDSGNIVDTHTKEVLKDWRE